MNKVQWESEGHIVHKGCGELNEPFPYFIEGFSPGPEKSLNRILTLNISIQNNQNLDRIPSSFDDVRSGLFNLKPY